jgi:hypothetical protein
VKAIFYDRKNNQEVSNEELRFVEKYENVITGYYPHYDRYTETHHLTTSEFEYNKDNEISFFECSYTDLIFLRFEDMIKLSKEDLEAVDKLTELFDTAFDVNHPAMLAWVRILLIIKQIKKEME